MNKSMVMVAIFVMTLGAGTLHASEPATAPTAPGPAAGDAALMRIMKQNSAMLVQQLMRLHRQVEKNQAQQLRTQTRTRTRTRARNQAKAGDGLHLRKMLRTGRMAQKGNLAGDLEKQARQKRQERARVRARTRSRAGAHSGGGGAGHGRR